MKEKKVLLYMHAGSGNHGCEAIIQSSISMLKDKISLLSSRKWEDEVYSLRDSCELLQEKKITENRIIHAIYLVKKLLTGNPMCYIKYRYQEVLSYQKYKMAISVGGDNYCYEEQVQDLILFNLAFQENEIPTILWGASIEESLLLQQDVKEDMLRYRAIFAREHMTYEALLKNGIPKEKVFLYPDPAFTLKAVEIPFPKEVTKENLIGINISPMVIQKEEKKGIVIENYKYLIEQILEHTDFQVILIPHVVWKENDDRIPLKELYHSFADSSRVVLLEDSDCMTLKGYIKRMRFLVAARTHASIAAYSTLVPTLVTGYSIKAKGIAEDLFGSTKHYVLQVQEMKEKEDLYREFEWIYNREQEIKEHLEKVMPSYQLKAKQAGVVLQELISQN